MGDGQVDTVRAIAEQWKALDYRQVPTAGDGTTRLAALSLLLALLMALIIVRAS